MEDRQQARGRESPEKQALAAAAVVDELAAHGAVQAVWAGPEITDRELGSVFTITIRQNAVGRGGAAESDDRCARRMDTTDGLNGDGVICRVVHLDSDFSPGMIAHQSQDTDQ